MASGGAISTNLIRFGGEFELDLRAFELRRSGGALKLERIPMELLLLLIEYRGQVVSRQQIVERVWGKDVFLDTDNSINAAIRKIRQVLGDDPDHPRFVQTLTGRGYRFIAPVEEVASSPSVAPATDPLVTADVNLIGKKVSHYRILEMLGSGGMGVVYKAEDLKLGRRVALKFLPSELASDPKAFDRMQREARAASALDHPNICAIYHLDEDNGQPFIVMQLLEGETLREWIENSSAQPVADRLKKLLLLTVQIADGLEAAHQKGILHGDIKPANIFVTTHGQAKILDFGVARIIDGELSRTNLTGDEAANPAEAAAASDLNLTGTGLSVGTPSYLSPEQIRREKLDARTDLFSFGLVLYEMATGQQAFPGKTVTAIRDAVLRVSPAPARQLSPGLPAELERIINKSLEKNRDHRYQSAAELRADLVHLTAAPVASGWRRFAPKAWIAVAAMIIAVALLASNVGGFRKRWFNRTDQAAAPPSFKARRSIAVLGFKNLSGKENEAWISTAMAEMVGAELGAGEHLRVIPSEDVARMKLDLSLAPADSYGQETLNKIRTHLNADMIVMGSYLAMGKDGRGKIRIDLQVQDTHEGETVAVISRDGAESDLGELVSGGSTILRQKLGLGDAANDIRQASASVPANLEAARYYAEGLAKLHLFDALSARDLLEKATRSDPNHALSHSALAEAWYALGYEAKAQAEAKIAFDLSGNLSREDHLSIEGRYRELTRDFPGAVEIYKTLHNFFPDQIDYGLHLASAQMAAGQSKDSLATIAGIRSTSPLNSVDPRVDLAEAKTQQAIGDFKRFQQLAATAAERARAQGAMMIVASARVAEGRAWDYLGEADKSTAALAEARELSHATNLNIYAEADQCTGHVFYDRGDFKEARKAYERALDSYKKVGALRGVARATESIGNVLYEQAKLEEAMRFYEEALRIQQTVSNKDGVASALGNLANALEQKGDLAGAARRQEEAWEAFRAAGDKRGEVVTAANWGNILVDQGQLDAARSKIEQSMAEQEKMGYKRGIGFCLQSLAEIAFDQGRLNDARMLVERAIALRKEIGDESNTAYSQQQLARVTLEQGRPQEAEAMAKSSAEVLHRLKSPEDEATCYTVLADAMLAQGKIKEAQVAAQSGLALVRNSATRSVRFAAVISAASANGAAGSFADAARNLEAVTGEARRDGYVVLEMESRLRLGQLENRSGKTTAAHTRLQSLSEEARGRGLLLIAHKAAAVQARSISHP
jgi:tetratricopeptide (TPR) repeat protein/DNA-binding winged helix-turn-helix (wHTH) protein/TolB-like protein